MEALADRPRAIWSMLLLMVATMAAWFIYVPVHELLHAFGCLATGGTVDELQIQVLYGGAILEKVFSFVQAGGAYAGRLSQFDTGGSDLVYLATDAAPYLLTVFGGFWLLGRARLRGNPLILGPAVVLLVAPALSLPGDYYEMGSIMVSRLIRVLSGSETAAAGVRHEDLLVVLGEFGQRFQSRRLAWGAAVAASALTGYVLASLTLAASRAWDRWITRTAENVSR